MARASGQPEVEGFLSGIAGDAFPQPWGGREVAEIVATENGKWKMENDAALRLACLRGIQSPIGD